MTLVKKLFGKHGHNRSRSDGDYDDIDQDSIADSLSDEPVSGPSGSSFNPYAINNNPYNSVSSAYARAPGREPIQSQPALVSQEQSPYASRGRLSSVSPPVTASSTVPLSPTRVPGLNGAPPLNPPLPPRRNRAPSANSHRNPYASEQKRFSDPIVYNPALSDQQGASPYDNPSAAESTDWQRQELLRRKKPSVSSLPQSQQQRQQPPLQFPAASRDYDPSIMETEQEREQRHAQAHSTSSTIPEDRVMSSEQIYDLQSQDNEEAEIQAMKQQIKFTNKKTVDSADTALRYAEEAEASGMHTLQMLGEASDQIGNSESSVAIAANKTKLAEDYTNELRDLNRNFLAVHISNPFNSRKKIAERDLQLRNDFQQQQKQREEVRARQYGSQQHIAGAMGNAPGERRRQLTDSELKYRQQMLENKVKLAEKSKYMFEPDTEDFDDEHNIEERLEHISTASSRLNSMAKAISSEVEDQNSRLKKLGKKTEDTELGVYLNTTRLARYG